MTSTESTNDPTNPTDYQHPDLRAERGAQWFDQVYPEWFTHVDLEELDLADTCRCVWGQTVPVDWDGIAIYNGGVHNAPSGYVLASKVLGIFGYGDTWFIDHGFLPNEQWGYQDNPVDGDTSDAGMLDEAWGYLIRERQKAAQNG